MARLGEHACVGGRCGERVRHQQAQAGVGDHRCWRCPARCKQAGLPAGRVLSPDGDACEGGHVEHEVDGAEEVDLEEHLE